jgi:hypothetical protein
MRAKVDWFSCNLPRVLENASHLLDVTLGPSTVREIVAPFSENPNADGSYPTIPIDFIDATVGQVLEQRHDDPRAPFYPHVAEGTQLLLSVPLAGSVFGLIANSSAVVAVGQLFHGTSQEWQLRAAMHIADDGTVAFMGPCAQEYGSQFSSLASGLDATPNKLFLERLIDEALVPGRGADLDYLSQPASGRGFDSGGGVPPSLAGKVRVIGLWGTPVGSANVVVGLRSEYGPGALSAAQAASGGSWMLPAYVPVNGDVEIIIGDTPDQYAPVLTIDAATMTGIDALHVTFDLGAMTATYEPLTIDQLAALSGWNADSLLSIKASLEAKLVPSTAVAQVEFFETGYPVSS